MAKEKIKVVLDGNERELPVIESTIGNRSIDIRKLGKYNYFTYDPGFNLYLCLHIQNYLC